MLAHGAVRPLGRTVSLLSVALLYGSADALIRFDPAIAGQTIVLSTGTLQIDKTLTIEGPLTAGMTISGAIAFPVFRIAFIWETHT
jgi:hypothetical protein